MTYCYCTKILCYFMCGENNFCFNLYTCMIYCNNSVASTFNFRVNFSFKREGPLNENNSPRYMQCFKLRVPNVLYLL